MYQELISFSLPQHKIHNISMAYKKSTFSKVAKSKQKKNHYVQVNINVTNVVNQVQSNEKKGFSFSSLAGLFGAVIRLLNFL